MTSTMTNWKIYVIQPAGRTNYVTNPSAEIDATGYTGLNATVTQSSEQARYGTYSVKAVPTGANTLGGIEYGAITAPATGDLTFSVSVKGEAGKTYRIMIYNDDLSTSNSLTFTANGYWQRRSVTLASTAGNALYLYVYRDANQNTTAAYYIDGLQLEAASTPSTYFDGSMDFLGNVRGRTEYYWTGTPHASTSVRVDWTNSGGTMLDLSTYCRIIAVLGLGMAQISPIYAPMVNGGSIYQWSRAGNRDIELVLDFNGANPGDVAQKISAVQKAFDATSNKYGQPTRLMLVGYNAAGTIEQSETVFVDVAYRGGLEGGFTNYYHERKNVQLLNFTPTMRAEGYTTAALDWQDALTGDCVVRVGADGTIDNAGVAVTTTTHTGRVMAKDNAGGLYLGGTFADLNGVAAADNIAYKAAGGTWAALGAGLNNQVYGIAIGYDSKVYAVGLFTDAGTIATADYIARWTGSAWESITTGGAADGTISALAFSRTGDLYVVGAFSNIGGVNAQRIARWDGVNWNAVVGATTLSQQPYAVIPDPWGDGVIIGGVFTNAGGDGTKDYLLRVVITGTTYTYELINGSTPNGLVTSIAYDPQSGRLYVQGAFTAIGSADMNYIAYYDGAGWWPLGSGTSEPPNVPSMVLSPGNGILYTAIDSASAPTAGGVILPDSFGIWSGNQWSAPKFNSSGTSYAGSGVFYDGDTGDVYWLGTSESATVEGRTSITNTDYGDTYPTLVITGPGTVYGIENYSNGDRVDFNNLTLIAGEYATIVFGPDGIVSAQACRAGFVSSRGASCRDLIPYIVPGSSPTFRLSPGINTVGTFIYGSTSAATAATLSWPTTYRAIEGAVR